MPSQLRSRITDIASEDLISTVSGQGNRHVPVHEFRLNRLQNGGGVSKGLVKMSDHFGQMPHTVGVGLKDMMAGSELLSHQLRGGQLIIKFAVGKTDAERLDRPLTALRSKDRDCAGIDSATQEYTNRDIAHQPDSHRFIDKRAYTIHSFRFRKPQRRTGCLERTPESGSSLL